MSKTEKVLEHLKKYGSITSWEAIEKYKATRLSAIIYILRHNKGMNIESQNTFYKTKDGTTGSYATYVLKEGN